jgi:hypothetical protein
MWASLVVLAVGALSSFSGVRPEAQRETRPVSPFTEVSLGGSAHVVLKQGSPQGVVVEASTEDLAEFETVVKDNQLRLGYRNDRNRMGNNRNHGSVTVYITAPTLTALRVGGSGKMEVDGSLKADAMTLAVAGSGSLLVPQLAASSLETALSGSGDVNVGGKCLRHNVRISGSGDAHVYASQTAEASISGSGSMYVAGGAQLSSSVHGSGRVTKE